MDSIGEAQHVQGNLALAWAGLGQHDKSFEGFVALNFASTAASFVAAVKLMHGFAGSFVFATVPQAAQLG